MNPLITIGVRILEILFFAGWIGSCLVLLLSAAEDVHAVFEPPEEEEANTR